MGHMDCGEVEVLHEPPERIAQLHADAGVQLWIPAGFAHGYVVLSDVADVSYKVTAEYDAKLDRGIRWDDPALAIDWPLHETLPRLAPKDRDAPAFGEAEVRFEQPGLGWFRMGAVTGVVIETLQPNS